jgi:hypothetical protein
MEELAVSNRVFFYNDGDRSGTTVEFDQSGKISKPSTTSPQGLSPIHPHRRMT